MNQSPEINELAAALSAFQGEVEAVSKTDFNPFFKSKYAGLPDVVKAASPLLAKHGLAVNQTLGYSETSMGCWDTLTTTLMHSSGQWISDTTLMHVGHDKDGNVSPQNHGSAVTYMRRYAYMAALGLVADEDDDGNAASKPPPKTVRGYEYQEKAAHPSNRRPPPQVTEISPKRRLLQACAGDHTLAGSLWDEATNGGKVLPTDMELKILLSRAEALAAAKPS